MGEQGNGVMAVSSSSLPITLLQDLVYQPLVDTKHHPTNK